MKKITVYGLMFVSVLVALLVIGYQAAVGEPLATIDQEVITSEEIEKSLGAQLSKLEEQIYDLKRQKLEEMISERVLAKEAAKRKISVPELLDAEVTTKVKLVTEQQIDAFYQANKERLKGDEANLRQQIRAYLQNQKLSQRRQEFLQALQSKAKVVVNLKPPPVFRAEVSADGPLSKGPKVAPVTIVKFEDFHCPFCKRAQPTLAELLSRYGKKVKLIHRDFPIDSLHPQARKAHEAARCASDQGKFWDYHDILYDNAPKASLDDLKAYAKQLGLSMAEFESCLTGGKYQAAVQADIDEGQRLGITGTPAFFINGRLLSGAQPLASFASLVDEELAGRR